MLICQLAGRLFRAIREDFPCQTFQVGAEQPSRVWRATTERGPPRTFTDIVPRNQGFVKGGGGLGVPDEAATLCIEVIAYAEEAFPEPATDRQLFVENALLAGIAERTVGVPEELLLTEAAVEVLLVVGGHGVSRVAESMKCSRDTQRPHPPTLDESQWILRIRKRCPTTVLVLSILSP